MGQANSALLIVSSISLQIAKVSNVPVVLDAGGIDSPMPPELLKNVTIFSPNETELARLTGMPTDTTEEVLAAAAKVQLLVSKYFSK